MCCEGDEEFGACLSSSESTGVFGFDDADDEEASAGEEDVVPCWVCVESEFFDALVVDEADLSAFVVIDA